MKFLLAGTEIMLIQFPRIVFVDPVYIRTAYILMVLMYVFRVVWKAVVWRGKVN